MESFTIHGLSKVFVGKPWEKLTWGIVLLAVLGFLGFKVNGFIGQYKRNEFRTEIRQTDAVNYTWPGIEVRGNTVLNRLNPSQVFDFCYQNYTYAYREVKIPCVEPKDYISTSTWYGTRINYTNGLWAPTISVRVNLSEVQEDTSENYFNLHTIEEGVPIRKSLLRDSAFTVVVDGDQISKFASCGSVIIYRKIPNVSPPRI